MSRVAPSLEGDMRGALIRAREGLPADVGIALVLGHVYGEGHAGGLGWALGTCRDDAIGLVVEWLAQQCREGNTESVRAAMARWFP